MLSSCHMQCSVLLPKQSGYCIIMSALHTVKILSTEWTNLIIILLVKSKPWRFEVIYGDSGSPFIWNLLISMSLKTLSKWCIARKMLKTPNPIACMLTKTSSLRDKTVVTCRLNYNHKIRKSINKPRLFYPK